MLLVFRLADEQDAPAPAGLLTTTKPETSPVSGFVLVYQGFWE
jgi:hypothetical protein